MELAEINFIPSMVGKQEKLINFSGSFQPFNIYENSPDRSAGWEPLFTDGHTPTPSLS